MRWAILILALMVAFVLGTLAAGAMLPEKHIASRAITLNRPMEDVWKVVTDHAQDPAWRPDVESVRQIEGRNGHPVWEEKYKNGQTMRIETILSDAPRRLERKIVDQSAFGGVWVYELNAQADGKTTTLRITENGEVHNPLFRLVGRFIIGNDTTVKKYLTNLATKFGEKSEPVQ